jgi:2-polyprenyl-6-methoxyphenol hydroxylase-like FAD-dependent oxidoreductase
MRILIVGAGIAGLSARRVLARHGFTVKVVERNPSAGLGGAGLFLPGNGVRALCDLGLQDGLFQKSHAVTAQRFYDEKGRLLTEIDANAYWRAVAPCRAIRRSDLWRLLNDGWSRATLISGGLSTSQTASTAAVSSLWTGVWKSSTSSSAPTG